MSALTNMDSPVERTPSSVPSGLSTPAELSMMNRAGRGAVIADDAAAAAAAAVLPSSSNGGGGGGFGSMIAAAANTM